MTGKKRGRPPKPIDYDIESESEEIERNPELLNILPGFIKDSVKEDSRELNEITEYPNTGFIGRRRYVTFPL